MKKYENTEMLSMMLDAGMDILEGKRSLHKLDLDLWCRLSRLRLKVIKGELTEEEAQAEVRKIAVKEPMRRWKNFLKF